MSRAEARRRATHSRALSLATVVIAVAIAVLAVFSAMPIYESTWLWLVAGVGAGLATTIVWLGTWLRWGSLTLVALAGVFAAVVVPLAVPNAIGTGPTGFVTGVGDGLAAVALGWKQLLTLTLPLGSYQTVMVPLLVVVFGSAAFATALTLRGGRLVPFAGIALVLPVLFGTVFGSSTLSAPVTFGGVVVGAPRELALWLAAFGLAIGWVSWSSGRARRAALKRGRIADAALTATSDASSGQPDISEGSGNSRRAVRRNTLIRGVIAGATVLAALAGAFVLAPVVNAEDRTVPRDRVDPELVVRSGVSPLAAYRASKRDDTLQAPLFSVASGDPTGALPKRLRIAVLAGYDGVDFTVGDPAEVGRFTRFPSGSRVTDPLTVSIEVLDEYASVWAPMALPIASPPVFQGPRAGSLAESFYVNRGMGSAVAVPGGGKSVADQMLLPGDGYTAVMSGAGDAALGETPVSSESLVDLEALPDLATWLRLQRLPHTGQGVTEAIERLRERGYLSHSLTDGEGEGAWLDELGTTNPIRFLSSTGGHSEARTEQLFRQLVEQELAAGEDAKPAMLVAGIGNDEQFAAAAALIARAMGFDSRVVVGVRLAPLGSDPYESGVPGVPACVDVCTGENLAAWIEVRGDDGVWAAFDVSPQMEIPPTMLQKGEQLPEFPTQPEERNADESDPPVGMSSQDSDTENTADANDLSALWPVLRIVGLSILGFVLLALLVLFVPVLKAVRTRRRREAVSPELRVLGAWDELLGTYRETGFEVPRSGSRDAIMATLGVESGDWIAWTVDQAVYSYEGISAETAESVWQLVEKRVAERRGEIGAWPRFKARFSLASFSGLTVNRPRGLRRRRSMKGA